MDINEFQHKHWRERGRALSKALSNESDRTESLRGGLSTKLWPVHGLYKFEDAVIRPAGLPGYERYWYYPMAHPELPFQLARVRDHDITSALEFVHKWGLLGYSELTQQPRLYWDEDTFLNGELIYFVWGHAYTVRNVLRLTRALQNFDSQALDEALKSILIKEREYIPGTAADWFSWRQMGGYDERLSSRSEISQRYPPHQEDVATGRWRQQPPLSREDMALKIIESSISQNITTLYPLIHVSREPEKGAPAMSRLSLEFAWSALVGVIYWHLASKVRDRRRIAICQQCGAFFEQTDPRQRFCPPPPQHLTEVHAGSRSRAQSLCGLRYRRRQEGISAGKGAE